MVPAKSLLPDLMTQPSCHFLTRPEAGKKVREATRKQAERKGRVEGGKEERKQEDREEAAAGQRRWGEMQVTHGL